MGMMTDSFTPYPPHQARYYTRGARRPERTAAASSLRLGAAASPARCHRRMAERAAVSGSGRLGGRRLVRGGHPRAAVLAGLDEAALGQRIHETGGAGIANAQPPL